VAVALLRTDAAQRGGGVAGLARLPMHSALKQACRNASLALQGRLLAPSVGTRCARCATCLSRISTQLVLRVVTRICDLLRC